MKDFDQKIQQALEVDEKEIIAQFEQEPAIHEMLAEMYRGKNRWLSILVSFLIFIFFIFSIYCAIQFFQGSSNQEWIGWATGFLFSQLVISMLKIWYMMEMQRHSIAREVKRLELQILHLSHLLQKKKSES